MTLSATGTFDVKLNPMKDEHTAGLSLARMTIDKTFQGGLQARSLGQMLAAGTSTDGSAGYVALEQVTGSLDGRNGSFVLQHSGTMNRGAASLQLTVVPDSGIGDLTGLSGAMRIIIDGDTHRYEFDYDI